MIDFNESMNLLHPMQMPEAGSAQADLPLPEVSAPTIINERKRLTLRDSFNMPRPEWTIKGLLPRRGIGQIYGPSYSGKTLLAVSLALAVSRGADWFGFRTRKTPVCYMAVEDPSGAIDMFRALAKNYAMSDSDLDDCQLRIDPEPFQFIDAIDLENAKKGLPKGCLIIVDTQAASSCGMDENSAKDMSIILDAAMALARSCEGFCLNVHHTGKDASKGARGSYSQFAANYLAIEVKKASDQWAWSAIKVKGAKQQGPFHYAIRQEYLGMDEDGDEITAAIAVHDPEADTAAQKARQTLQEKGGKKLSKGALYGMQSFQKALGPFSAIGLEIWRNVFYEGHTADNKDSKARAFRRARSELVDSGILEVHDDLYSVASQKDGQPDKGGQTRTDMRTKQFVRDFCPPEAIAQDKDGQPDKPGQPDKGGQNVLSGAFVRLGYLDRTTRTNRTDNSPF